MSFALLPPRWLELPAELYCAVRPQGLPRPVLAAASPGSAALLGLDPAQLRAPEFLAWAAGNALPPGTQPLATVYAGHQFGVYVPQLGDGRVILLGEVAGTDGQRYELQLKGAGPTPFARGADGRLGLTAALRELLACEALAGLGIPTARVLAVVAGDLPVQRAVAEPAAVAVRLAPSHLRFGTLEYAHWRGRPDLLRALADHLLTHHFPQLEARAQPYLALFEAVTARTAALLAAWQASGFVHGVLNTDNMAVLGHTLDIGPCAFVEAFDPHCRYNASDAGGRYVYARQAAMGFWNLRALAHALRTLLPEGAAGAVLEAGEQAFLAHYGALMRARLGLTQAAPQDGALVDRLLALLAATRADYPAFLRRLAAWDPAESASAAPLRELVTDAAGLDVWLADYGRRLATESGAVTRRARMEAVNPLYVLRGHLAEAAFAAARVGDCAPVERLRALLASPFTAQPGAAVYAQPPPAGSPPVPLSCLT